MQSAKLEIVWRNPQAVHRRQRWEALDAGSKFSSFVVQEFLCIGDYGFWNTTCYLQILSERGIARRNGRRQAG